jgi:hypothetical protein
MRSQKSVFAKLPGQVWRSEQEFGVFLFSLEEMGMSEKSVGMRVDVFVDQLRDELKKICKAQGKSYDDNQARGFAFQEWVAELLMKYHEVDRGKDESVFTTNDLKIDVAFEDDENKILCLSQTKNVSINSDVNESDVLDFFSRHDVFLENPEWVREHASDELHDLISDYRQRLGRELINGIPTGVQF